MRLIDKFGECLLYQPFMEMAYYRKEASDKIRSLSGTIIKNMIKFLYLNDNCECEIISYFDKIGDITIKPRNKKFTKEEYYNFLFLEPYCFSNSNWKGYEINDKYIKMIIRDINSQYNSNLDIEDIDFDKISNLFKKISNKISNYESVVEIIKKINE